MKVISVSFIFPMFNEAANINETLRKATALAREISGDYEIVVVDDASTDGSGYIVDGLASDDPHIRSIRLKANTKFGGALKEGLKNGVNALEMALKGDLTGAMERYN